MTRQFRKQLERRRVITEESLGIAEQGLGARVQKKSSSGVLRFGSFEVNLQSGELRRNGFKIRLQDQPLQVLTLLLEQPGEVVTREALRGKLWAADTFVDFDHSLNAAVKRLRDALGDSADSPRFIETLARRGYRFIAPVTAPFPTMENRAAAGNALSLPVVSSAPRFNLTGCLRQHGLKLAVIIALISMAIGAGWVAARRVNPKVQITEQRLTANTADDPIYSAVISPDGKYLAFSDRSGIYLRVVASGETHPIQQPDAFRARPTGWLPDGNHLLVSNAFEYGEKLGTEKTQNLWSVSFLGGGPHKIVENARSGAISPDGTQVAFVRAVAVSQEIWLAPLTGGEQRKVIAEPRDGLAADSSNEHYRRILGEPGDVFGNPAWSPDGKKFAFTRYVYKTGYRDGDVSLGICDAQSGQVDFILSDRRLGESLAWTSDSRIVYSLAEAPPNQRDSNLWAQALDARSNRLVGEAQRLTNGPDVKAAVSYSAASKRLTFLRRSSEPHIYVAQLEAGGERLGPPRTLSLEEGRNLPFTWTADSSSLLFISDREGSYHLFKQTPEQPAPDLLADGRDAVMGARLTPDGRDVLYLVTPDASDTEGRVRLMRMPVSGGTPQLVLEEPQVENMQCARLPSKLCLFSRNEAHAIRFFRFDPATGAKQELTQFARTSELKFNWTLSADGSMLALAPWREGQNPGEIQIVSLASGNKRTITLAGWSQIGSIDWAADSRNIWASACDASGTRALILVNLRGKVRTMLEDAQKQLGWAIPAPDGKKVAIWQASGSSNAWMLQGF